jgi:type II secretory pathway component PulF
VEEALLAEDQPVPPTYRCLMQIGLRSGDVSTALQGFSQLARTAESSRHAIRLSLLYPLVVCCVAYVGLVGLCLFFVPILSQTYREMEVREGFGLQIMQAAEASLPYWAAIPPILVVVVLWKLWSRSSEPARRDDLWTRLPGTSRTIQLERWANFADGLGVLIQAGTPLDDALALASCAGGDTELATGVRELSLGMQRGQLPAEDVPAARYFPPFLRWALWHSEATIGRVRALKMAAEMYRDTAQRRMRRLWITAPLVACVVLGGGVTLLYGLALFLPVVQLLRGLAY